MSVSAKEVAELRRRTNAGMMDCKKALIEANNDMEKAIALLKEWGIAKAAKKGDRGANEGVMNVVISKDHRKGVLVEVNCETDFVSNTKEFKDFAKDVAQMVFDKGDTNPSSLQKEITDKIAEGVAQFGENILISSIKIVEGNGVMGSYVHSNFKNATIVVLEGEGDLKKDSIANMAKDVAVHISANTVEAVSSEALDPKLIEEKKQEFLKEIEAQGKPAHVAEKILQGKMQKFFKEETLLGQPFLKNEEITVEELVQKISKETGTQLKITRFIKTVIGE
jgi:elongation factor Ts